MKSTHLGLLALGLGLWLALEAGGGAVQSADHQRMNLPGRTDDLPYCHGVLAGDTFYVAGTLGLDPATGKVPEEVEQEIRLALDGVKHKLALANLDMQDLVSVQVFCPDLTLYEKFNAIYRGYFPEDRYPARAFVGSGPLLRNARFEINGIAVRRAR